jgi:hypothetical protein
VVSDATFCQSATSVRSSLMSLWLSCSCLARTQACVRAFVKDAAWLCLLSCVIVLVICRYKGAKWGFRAAWPICNFGCYGHIAISEVSSRPGTYRRKVSNDCTSGVQAGNIYHHLRGSASEEHLQQYRKDTSVNRSK